MGVEAFSTATRTEALAAKLGGFASLTKGLKLASDVLGPAGDALGAILDGKNSYDAFAAGDTTAGMLYGGAAAAGGTAALLGTLAALGVVSGPVGWVALGVGLLGVGLSVAASAMKESPDVALLRRVDMWTPAAEIHYGIKGWLDDESTVAHYRNLRENSPQQFEKIAEDYEKMYDKDLWGEMRKSRAWNFTLNRGVDLAYPPSAIRHLF